MKKHYPIIVYITALILVWLIVAETILFLFPPILLLEIPLVLAFPRIMDWAFEKSHD